MKMPAMARRSTRALTADHDMPPDPLEAGGISSQDLFTLEQLDGRGCGLGLGYRIDRRVGDDEAAFFGCAFCHWFRLLLGRCGVTVFLGLRIRNAEGHCCQTGSRDHRQQKSNGLSPRVNHSVS
jgi:hypothetical protein